MLTVPTYGPFRVHPLLDLFPLTIGDDFAFLVDSIRENGVLVPVLVDQEGRTLLHGRARVLATIAAGRDPDCIPRQLLPPGIRHEAVLDLILTGVIEGHRLEGTEFLELALVTRPFYDAVALRRARFGQDRPHLAAVSRPTLRRCLA